MICRMEGLYAALVRTPEVAWLGSGAGPDRTVRACTEGRVKMKERPW